MLRREDPRIAERVHRALGDARTVDGEQERGVRELRRVARGAVVILTFDPQVSNAMWLTADYLPELAALDARIFPRPELLAQWLGPGSEVDVVPIPRDTPDWTFGAFSAHPERVLDADARAATSGFARMPAEVSARVADAVAPDLRSGEWDRRHGRLRALDEFDAGLRLVVNRPIARRPGAEEPFVGLAPCS